MLENVAFWWGKVLVFLGRQGPAERFRHWPGKGDTGAHGADAALARAEAELAAATHGAHFAADLCDGRLVAIASRRGGHRRVRLFRDGRRIASVDVKDEEGHNASVALQVHRCGLNPYAAVRVRRTRRGARDAGAGNRSLVEGGGRVLR